MTRQPFQESQFQFAGYLRDPDHQPAPADVEDRRLAIYRDLIYNNVEGFLASGFPVLKSIIDDDHWHGLVRDFLAEYRCQTPYFLEIGQEFLRYLQEVRQPRGWEPPYMLELAHYEWVELALDTATDDVDCEAPVPADPLDTRFQVSPLVWRLSYSYPVHRISASFLPEDPVAGGVHLVVYRNASDEVGFLEINEVVARLIQLIDDRDGTLRDVLVELAREIRFADEDEFRNFALPIVRQLCELSILSCK